MDTNHTDLVIKQEEDPLGNEFVEYIYTGEYNSHEEEDNLQKLDDDYDYEETDDSPVPKRSKLSTEDMANNSSNDNITQGYTKTNNSPTAETTNIKSTRLSKSQKDALIEFMRTHRDLVNSNKLDGKVNKYIDRHELWLLITNKLNKLGPPKHLHKWKKCNGDYNGEIEYLMENEEYIINEEYLPLTSIPSPHTEQQPPTGCSVNYVLAAEAADSNKLTDVCHILTTLTTNNRQITMDIILSIMNTQDFQSFLYNERRILIMMKQPKPDTVTFKQMFEPKLFNTYKWLTGSAKLHRLFCWPCVIFYKKSNRNRWNYFGITSSSHKMLTVHQSSRMHISIVSKFNAIRGTNYDTAVNSGIIAKPPEHNKIRRLKLTPDEIHYTLLLQTQNIAITTDTILSIIQKNDFQTFSTIDQKFLVTCDKPKPEMLKYNEFNSTTAELLTTKFNKQYYEDFEWLTGSVLLRKLFCWPCLIFHHKNNSIQNSWNDNGVSWRKLTAKATVHETNIHHILNVLQFKTMAATNATTSPCGINNNNNNSSGTTDATQHIDTLIYNRIVARNHDIVKLLINIIDYLTQLNIKNVIENYSNLFQQTLINNSKYNAILSELFNENNKLNWKIKDYDKILVQSMSHVLREYIRDEIKNAHFVVIMVDDTINVLQKTLISVVIRFVCKHNFNVNERFFKFKNINNADSFNNVQTINIIYDFINEIVQTLNCSDKLIGIIYEGASITHAKHINSIQNKFNLKYPNLLPNLHSTSYDLNIILSRGCSYFKLVQDFFTNIFALQTFFTHSSERLKYLEYIININGSNDDDDEDDDDDGTELHHGETKLYRLNSIDYFLKIVNKHFIDIKNLFKNMIKKPHNFESDIIVLANGFINFFINMDMILLLKIFTNIFRVTKPLENNLKLYNDTEVCRRSAIETIKKLKLLNFEDIFTELLVTIKLMNNDVSKVSNLKLTYQSLFLELTSRIIEIIEERFLNSLYLDFMNVLHNSHTSNYQLICGKVMNSTVQLPFNYAKLLNEIIVYHNSEMLNGKQQHDLSKFIGDHNLAHNFSELLKLNYLILTLPFTKVKNKSYFKTCKNYLKNYIENNTNSFNINNNLHIDFGNVFIERDLFKYLIEHDGSFYKKVIDDFAKRIKVAELFFL